MPSLTMRQIQLFRNNGFLCLPDRLPEEMVENLKTAIMEDIDRGVEPIVRNKDGRPVRISALMDRASIFREAVTHPFALDPLESLLGPNIEILTNRHNHATLRTAEDNKGAYLHRDVRQWTRTIYTIIFYLEETTLENGCTVLYPDRITSPVSPHPFTMQTGQAMSSVKHSPSPCPQVGCSQSTAWSSTAQAKTTPTTRA